MTRLVVQMDDRGGWEVLDDTGESLFYSNKIRAEGFARRACAEEGGTITVVGRTGEQLGEYAVRPWSGQAPGSRAGRGGPGNRRRR